MEQCVDCLSIRCEKEGYCDFRFQGTGERPGSELYEEIAEKLDTKSKVVSRWVCKYVKDGIDSLLPKECVGNLRNMSSDEEKEFLSQYKEKAEKGQIVEVSEIKKAYDEKIGHTSGRGQIYRVLHRNGWRKVMPRSRHPKKADDEAIEASKKSSQKSPKYEVSTIQR